MLKSCNSNLKWHQLRDQRTQDILTHLKILQIWLLVSILQVINKAQKSHFLQSSEEAQLITLLEIILNLLLAHQQISQAPVLEEFNNPNQQIPQTWEICQIQTFLVFRTKKQPQILKIDSICAWDLYREAWNKASIQTWHQSSKWQDRKEALLAQQFKSQAIQSLTEIPTEKTRILGGTRMVVKQLIHHKIEVIWIFHTLDLLEATLPAQTMLINRCQDQVGSERTETQTFPTIGFLTILNTEVASTQIQPCKRKEIQTSVLSGEEVAKTQTLQVNLTSKETYFLTHMTTIKAMHQNSNITSNKTTQC